MAEPTKSMQYRVLLVDDDRDMISLLSSWLKDAGFEVDPVMSGSEAIARIDVFRPHLVITDLVMQGMDGMTLLSKIHRQNPLMPVIMLSGKAQIADAVKAMHLGIAEFLTKPLTKDELVARVRYTLRLAAGESDSGANFGKEIIYRSEKIT
ncbi:MAG: response regulator, partial [Gammaproteobacteria bacterium]|nr:response regulator [Gammaproteobacteria bacterium]